MPKWDTGPSRATDRWLNETRVIAVAAKRYCVAAIESWFVPVSHWVVLCS